MNHRYDGHDRNVSSFRANWMGGILFHALLLFFLLAGTLVAPAVGPLTAQEPEGVPPEGRGFFMLGLHSVAADDLNDQLLGAGYPAFSTSLFTIGGGGMGMLGAFLLGGEGHALIGADKSTADGALRTRLHGGYGMLNVGYDLFPDEARSLYPLLGVGAGSMAVRIDERTMPLFEDVLDEPRRGVEISRVSLLLMVGLGGDRMLEFPGAEDAPGGLAVGLRVGYVVALGQGSWSTGVGDVAGGPDLSPSGPYVRLQIGGRSRP